MLPEDSSFAPCIARTSENYRTRFACVMAEPKIQMAVIAGRIPDAVWNDLACRPTRKIVIESFKSLLTIYASVAIEKSQVFFLLEFINAEHWISLRFVGLSQIGDMLKLLVTFRNGSSMK